MPTVIAAPSVIQAAGHPPKRIEEYAGRVNSGHANVSVARMQSPSGWKEPGQRPDFEEITIVLRGMVRVEHENGVIDVHAGQAVVTHPGEWVRYSSPGPDGAEYVAVCLPAFSMDTVNRDPNLNLEIQPPWPLPNRSCRNSITKPRRRERSSSGCLKTRPSGSRT